MLDIPADANPARVYGTPEFERARMARIPMLPRRFVEDQRDPPPFRNLREQHAHYTAVRARLNSGKIIETPTVREEIVEPEPEVAPPEFVPPAFWLGPIVGRDLPLGASPNRDWLFINVRLRCATIIMATAGHFSVPVIDILSQRRTANVVKPRQIAMYLAKTLTLRSLPEIGRRFGGRDHTTVLHAVRKIDRLIEGGDAAVQADVAAIRGILGVKE